MEIRADWDSKFMLRFLLISLLLLGFGLYSLYDGFIAYPAEKLRAEAFYAPEMEELEESARVARWQEVAKENGWKRSQPEKPDAIQIDIYWQYGMAIMCFPGRRLFVVEILPGQRVVDCCHRSRNQHQLGTEFWFRFHQIDRQNQMGEEGNRQIHLRR